MTYTLVIELKYLGEMAQLDHEELTAVYMLIRQMELALVGARVGEGIKHTKKLQVLNYK